MNTPQNPGFISEISDALHHASDPEAFLFEHEEELAEDLSGIDHEGEKPTHKLHGKAEIAGAEVAFTVESQQPLEGDEAVDPANLTWVMIVNGYGGIKTVYAELGHELAQLDDNWAVVRYALPRSQKNFGHLHPKHLLHPERLLSQAPYSVWREINQRYGVEGLHLIGHSMGTPVSFELAEHRPEMVKSITCLAGAGLEDHTTPDFIPRSLKFARKELIPSIGQLKVRNRLQVAARSVYYIFRNPARTVGEGIWVSNRHITDEEARNLGAMGIKLGGLVFEDDELLPAQNTLEQSQYLFGDRLEVFGGPTAGHVAPQLHTAEVAAQLYDIHRKINREDSEDYPAAA